MNTITENSVISRVNAGLAAGTGTTTATAVSMVGFNAVTFLLNLSTVASGGNATLSVEGSNDGSTWTALAGSATRDAAGVLALEVTRPTFAQVRAVLTRADANVTTDALMAIRTKAGQVPTDDAGQTVGVLVSPEAA